MIIRSIALAGTALATAALAGCGRECDNEEQVELYEKTAAALKDGCYTPDSPCLTSMLDDGDFYAACMGVVRQTTLSTESRLRGPHQHVPATRTSRELTPKFVGPLEAYEEDPHCADFYTALGVTPETISEYVSTEGASKVYQSAQGYAETNPYDPNVTIPACE